MITSNEEPDICFIYTPPECSTAIQSPIGVKFRNDVMLMESFLNKNNITYTKEDLEQTPYGLCFRIKSTKLDYKTVR